ncbi:hypothetical protein KUF59_42875 [Bradyrhizobium arachidis]|nr:hypothetical protein KUF59_42875 [Bradyrhizobium arachidis]
MVRQTRTAGARTQRSWPQDAELLAPDARVRPAGRRPPAAPTPPKPVPGPMKSLSVRAQNVLKELAVELTGEQPPKGPWSPSRELLLALSAERLATARNCGPRTMREIIAWAQGCGVTIRPTVRPGGSLSEMWAGLIANASSGALTSAEIVGALQRSIRRKSVRIPVAFQVVLVKILLSGFE